LRSAYEDWTGKIQGKRTTKGKWLDFLRQGKPGPICSKAG